MEEYLPLYDRQGKPLGRELRRGDPPPEGALWRVCDVWIVNDAGQLLIQRRADTRPTNPGKWACTGGAIHTGEDGEAGCLRETREELGFEPDRRRMHSLFEFVGQHAIHEVWLLRQNVSLDALHLQQEEVADARYATMEEILRMARQGEFVALGYLSQLAQMLPVLLHAYGKDDTAC